MKNELTWTDYLMIVMMVAFTIGALAFMAAGLMAAQATGTSYGIIPWPEESCHE